jgi:hypothetical protein
MLALAITRLNFSFRSALAKVLSGVVVVDGSLLLSGELEFACVCIDSLSIGVSR